MKIRAALVVTAIAGVLVQVAHGADPLHATGITQLAAPAGSVAFGTEVHVLANGNIVVTDPYYTQDGLADLGAVHLYSGTTLQRISTLRGSTAGDKVGQYGVTEVGTSDFVVSSPSWDYLGVADAGAITWVDGAAGLNGVVSGVNSITGGSTNDRVGDPGGVTVLTNGNYVVSAPALDLFGMSNVGGVLWANGSTRTATQITTFSSLHGDAADERVGNVYALSNGNFVVVSTHHDNDRGAVTWGDGSAALVGSVSALNSLVGSTPGDRIGEFIALLTNGNYVVGSPSWDGPGGINVGAATWRPGTSASPDVVSAANSLIGAVANDGVGNTFDLPNGNYVALSPDADVNGVPNSGAVTWGNGVTGTVGTVNTANSAYSLNTGARFGNRIAVLTNGNYVAGSDTWDNGPVVNAGIATWRPGTGPSPGLIGPGNSLVGTSANDHVGGVLELSNGNYVAFSPDWDNGSVLNVGAVTWGNGATGTSGPVTTSNSLYGAAADDNVGSSGATELADGSYVVGSPGARFGPNDNAGAVTLLPGTGPSSAVVSAANSLIGTNSDDSVGQYVLALPGGGYLASNFSWSSGTKTDIGAVTFVAPGANVVGPVSAANSLIGSTSGDKVGLSGFDFLPDNSVAFVNEVWDNGTIVDAGALTIVPPAGLTGMVGSGNSVLGDFESAYDGGASIASRFVRGRSLVAGIAASNVVLVLSLTEVAPLPPARLADTRPGFETVDGVDAGGGLREAGSTLELTVAGRGGVPADAVAAVLNVTAVDAVAAGFVTVHPCGNPRPLASNLDMVAGAAVPNAVVARLGTGGRVCIYVSQPTHLVVDVNGYFPYTTSYRGANPARLLDSRPGEATIDGAFAGGGQLVGGTVFELNVAGRAGVPGNASAVALNVTVVGAVAAGYLTVFPCGVEPPTASNLNYVAGQTVANLVIVKLGTGGRVCLYSQNATHVVADLNGYFPALTAAAVLSPARLLDSRPAMTTIDGQSAGIGFVGGGSVTPVVVTGRGGVSSSAVAVVLNVTVTEPIGPGYVTVYPCGIDPPLASNVNYVGNQTVPNAVIVTVGAGGAVCIFNSQPTHLVVDVSGYFEP